MQGPFLLSEAASLSVAAGAGAGLEQVEQSAVLEQQLLAAERQRALAARAVEGRVDHLEYRAFVGKHGGWRFDSETGGDAVEQAANGPPVAGERGRCAKCAAAALGTGEDLQGVALCKQAGLGLGRAWRAWKRADRGGEAEQIEPLALEALRSISQPRLSSRVGAMFERKIDESGVAAVKAAQKMHGIGEIAAGVGAGAFDQRLDVRMARAPLAGHAGKLRFGNADRLKAD